MNETAAVPRTYRRIDAHHHLWRYNPQEFDWIGDDMSDLRRDFIVAELVAELDRAGVDATVAVQARRTIEETDWLLTCAKETDRIAGIVGWLPLDQADLPSAIERFGAEPLLCGVREVAQGQPAGFLLRPEFQQGIALLTEAGLTYDILIYAGQLGESRELVHRHPQQTFLLDHAAKPQIARGELGPWRSDLLRLAELPNVACKLSGLVTEANWRTWTLGDLRPYLDCCVEAFGPGRLLAGSDWPVCLVATKYDRWWQTLSEYFAVFSPDERDDIFGGNALGLYNIPSTARESTS